MLYSMFSKRGNPLKVFDDYKFRKGRLTKDGQKWRCNQPECRMTLLTDAAGDELIKISEGTHSHDREVNLPRQYLTSSVKRKAVDDITEKPAKLLRTEIAAAPADIRRQLTRADVCSVRTSIYRSRHSTTKYSPKNIQYLNDAVDDVKMKSADEDQPPLINDGAKNIVIFTDGNDFRFFLEYKSGRIERCEYVERILKCHEE